MPTLKAVTYDDFAASSWRRPESYMFAADEPITALGAVEVSKAMFSMAIGFVPDNEDFLPVAVQGIKNGQNLLVDDNGRWIENYVPAIYRSHPFRLAKNNEGQHFLCINEDSKLVSDDGSAEPFYSAPRELSENTRKVFDLLVENERDRMLATKICKSLNYAGVIEPWPMRLETEGEIQEITGLFRISEEKLNSLDAEDFAQLREGGSILLAYCQLLSMQHIYKLGKLAWNREKSIKQKNQNEPAALSFGNDSGTLSFGNL